MGAAGVGDRRRMSLQRSDALRPRPGCELEPLCVLTMWQLTWSTHTAMRSPPTLTREKSFGN